MKQITHYQPELQGCWEVNSTRPLQHTGIEKQSYTVCSSSQNYHLSIAGRASADAIEPFSLLQSHPSAAPEVVVVEPLEPTQTLDIDERVADEAATAQQQMQDPLWLPPEIAKPPEAKCEPEIQVAASFDVNVKEVCLIRYTTFHDLGDL